MNSNIVKMWGDLHKQNPSLPQTLREPQIDALYWLLKGQHVMLCVGTGGLIHLRMCRVFIDVVF